MKRTVGVLVVAVLLSMTAQSEGPNGDTPTRVTKSYAQILAEVFGLKPVVAPRSKLPASAPNMRCQNCDDSGFTPTPDDCARVLLCFPCKARDYCAKNPNDPRCGSSGPL